MDYLTKVMTVSIFTNVFLAIIKIICGIIFSSSALIADGINSFSDIWSDTFAIIGNKLARKPADEEHPFGHGKIEYLTSLIIGIIILFVGLGVIYKSASSEVIIPSKIVILVAGITIIMKYFLSKYVIRKGRKYQNNILIASGKDSRNDMVSSFVVLITSILMQFSNNISLLKYSDIIGAIIVGLFIIKTGYDILKENVSGILGEQEKDLDYLDSLSEIILKSDIVIEIKNLVILKYGHTRTLNLTISMDGNISLKRAHNLVDIIEHKIRDYDKRLEHLNIHMEPNKNDLTNGFD